MILQVGLGLEQFGLTELGIIGALLSILLVVIRFLYKQNMALYDKILKSQEAHTEELSKRNDHVHRLVINNSRVLTEVLLYLKFVHTEKTEHYEEFLKTLQLPGHD